MSVRAGHRGTVQEVDRGPPQRSVALKAAALRLRPRRHGDALVALLGAAQTATATSREEASRKALTQAEQRPCFGAVSCNRAQTVTISWSDAVHLTSQAAADKPVAYADKCWTSPRSRCASVATGRRQTPPSASRWSATPMPGTGSHSAGHRRGTPLGDQHVRRFRVLPGGQAPEVRQGRCITGLSGLGPLGLDQTAGQGFDLIVTSERTGPWLTGVPQGQQESAAAAEYRDTLDRWVARAIAYWSSATPPVDDFVVPDCIGAHLDDLGKCDGRAASASCPTSGGRSQAA